MPKLVLVGISREGKIFEKLFITSKGVIDIQFSEDFLSITFNDKISCIQTKNLVKLNGDIVKGDCKVLMRKYINCIDDILRNFNNCENADLLDNIKLLDERIKYVIYLTMDEIILPFTGEQEMDTLSFDILTEYKKRISAPYLVNNK